MVPVYDGVSNTTSYTYKYFLKDHLGSTRAVIDDQGQLTEATVYSPYGMMDKIEQGTDVRDKFTGKEFDEEGSATGIPGIQAFYFGARMYDPDIGVFTSCDPKLQFWSSYAYTTNPNIYIDPNGEDFSIPAALLALAITTATMNTANYIANVVCHYKEGTDKPWLAALKSTNWGLYFSTDVHDEVKDWLKDHSGEDDNKSKKGSQPKNSGDAIELGEKVTDPVLVKQLSDAASVLEDASYESDGTRWESRAWMYLNENNDWAMGTVQPRLPGEPNDKFSMSNYGETMPNYTVRGINHYHWGDEDYHKNLSIDDVAELYEAMYITKDIKGGFGFVFASSKHHVAVGRINLSLQYAKGIGWVLMPNIDGEYYYYVERSH